MSELTMSDLVMDLRMHLGRLEGTIDDVDRAIAEGKLDSAALELGSQTGKIVRFTASWAALQAKLREEGASAERAIRRES
jgi:hypothetical protein